MIWEITNPALRRSVVSATFHGRDILAPASAHLVKGGDRAELGPRRDRFVTLRNFEPNADEHGFVGEVIFRDAFGNLITNVSDDRLGDTPPRPMDDRDRRRASPRDRAHLRRPSPGSLVALLGSSGWVEVAVVNGDAARQLTAGAGTTVWFRRRV